METKIVRFHALHYFHQKYTHMATSTKKKGEPKPPPNTVTVTHEEVPFTPDPTKAPAPLKIYTTEEIVALYLQRLSPAEQQLAELEEKYAALTAPIPVTDKAAYKAGKEAWREVQAFRTKVEAEALSMRREQTTINKAIAGKEGQIVDRATPLETRLQARWKAVDDEQQRLEREEEERQEKALRQRLDELTELGMTLTDGYYGIGDTITVDVATLRIMPPEKYEKLKLAVTGRASELLEAETNRQRQEQERQQQLEDERRQAREANKETRGMLVEALGLVLEAESNMLIWTNGDGQIVVTEAELYDVDHAAFTAKVIDLKSQMKKCHEIKERKQEQEQERQRRISRDNRDRDRMHALAQAGLRPHGAHVVYEDGYNEPLRVGFDELLDLEDDKAFGQRVIELSNQVGALRTKFNQHEEEKAEKARLLKLRKDKIAMELEAIGFKFQYSQQAFEYTHSLYSIKFGWDELLELDDEAFQQLIKTLEVKIGEALEQQKKLDKAETERQEQERQAGLTDAQNFTGYLMALASLKPPTMKTKKGKQHADTFNTRLAALLKEFEPKSAKKEVSA